MRYAYNNNGVLQDVVGIDPFRIFISGYAERFIEVPDNVENGWVWNGSEFVEPPEADTGVPVSVTQRQGRVILARYGLLAAVTAYFAGEGMEEQQIEFEYAQEWRRDWQTLIDAAHSFGLTDEQIDQMFIEGSSL